eukprot:5217232-Pleurochrysis_carterae.AAC.1
MHRSAYERKGPFLTQKHAACFETDAIESPNTHEVEIEVETPELVHEDVPEKVDTVDAVRQSLPNVAQGTNATDHRFGLVQSPQLVGHMRVEHPHALHALRGVGRWGRSVPDIEPDLVQVRRAGGRDRCQWRWW